MTSVNLPAVSTDLVRVSGVSVTPCYSLKVTGVQLYFCVDSNPFPAYEQHAGMLTGFQVLESTIRLAGAKGNVIQNKVVVAELTSNQIDHSFWFGAHPELNDYEDVTLHHGNLDNPDGLPRWLIEGQVTDWMVNNQGVHVRTCTAEVQADYTIGGTVYKDQKLVYKYVATDAVTKSYTWGSGFTPPETPPSGLAALILSALSPLHYKGSLTIVDSEIGVGAALLGHTLNLTGSKTAWASMAALITGVREQLFNGRTQITFGPPPCLSTGDMMAINRANRIRMPAGSAQAKKDQGAQTSSNTPSVGGTGGGSGGISSGTPKVAKLVITSPDGSKTLTIDPADASDVVFNVLIVTGYGEEGMSLASLPVKKKGDVLVISGEPTNLSTLDCASSGGS